MNNKMHSLIFSFNSLYICCVQAKAVIISSLAPQLPSKCFTFLCDNAIQVKWIKPTAIQLLKILSFVAQYEKGFFLIFMPSAVLDLVS